MTTQEKVLKILLSSKEGIELSALKKTLGGESPMYLAIHALRRKGHSIQTINGRYVLTKHLPTAVKHTASHSDIVQKILDLDPRYREDALEQYSKAALHARVLQSIFATNDELNLIKGRIK